MVDKEGGELHMGFQIDRNINPKPTVQDAADLLSVPEGEGEIVSVISWRHRQNNRRIVEPVVTYDGTFGPDYRRFIDELIDLTAESTTA